MRWQLHLLVYYYGPSTRAMSVLWMCRVLGGSGQETDPDEAYQSLYLKADMQYACWTDTHFPVFVASVALWALYAVICPLVLAFIIHRDKSRITNDVDGEKSTNYWTSTTPTQERFFFPLIAHLMPKYWCASVLLADGHPLTRRLQVVFHRGFLPEGVDQRHLHPRLPQRRCALSVSQFRA